MKPSRLAVIFMTILATVLISCERQAPVPTSPPAEPPAEAPALPVAPATADASAPVKPYPLDVCIVSDEALDSMGKPIALVYDGQEYKFCCDSCPVAFRKNPQKYVAKLQAAVAARASAAGQPQSPAQVQSQ